jgi:hypothetical protein
VAGTPSKQTITTERKRVFTFNKITSSEINDDIALFL